MAKCLRCGAGNEWIEGDARKSPRSESSDRPNMERSSDAAQQGAFELKAQLCTTTTFTGSVNKTHKQAMLEALHDADFWHGKQAHDRINKKKKLMHRKYQQAIWWAIENLEAVQNGEM